MSQPDGEQREGLADGGAHGRRGFAVAAAVAMLAVAMAWGLGRIGSGLALRASDVISVRGTAQRNVTADRAVWRLSVAGSGDTAATALTQVETGVETLVAYLVGRGVEEAAITRGSVSVYANKEWINGNQTGRVLSYDASREIVLRLTDVELTAALAADLGEVLAKGVTVSTAGPEYYFDGLDDLRPELLAEAMTDARTRATTLLDAVDGELGRVRGVSSGPFQVTAADATNVDAGGYYDTASIEKTVVATVLVDFATK